MRQFCTHSAQPMSIPILVYMANDQTKCWTAQESNPNSAQICWTSFLFKPYHLGSEALVLLVEEHLYYMYLHIHILKNKIRKKHTSASHPVPHLHLMPMNKHQPSLCNHFAMTCTPQTPYGLETPEVPSLGKKTWARIGSQRINWINELMLNLCDVYMSDNV